MRTSILFESNEWGVKVSLAGSAKSLYLDVNCWEEALGAYLQLIGIDSEYFLKMPEFRVLACDIFNSIFSRSCTCTLEVANG
ncbi:hypothetical protein [uncultured Zhongshania sp.]|uniref:hypothetical protein n=1 Tax=uncultured Zhongshania sp. TaxID=1642288 RepID=UPI0030D82DC9|tara:strand:- start:7400 stop:7645 length:246 start_codon:yes stop_codon:yes gene_type:complete